MKILNLILLAFFPCAFAGCTNEPAAGNQPVDNAAVKLNREEIGGGVGQFVKDTAAFNRAFKNDLVICNFKYTAVNGRKEGISFGIIHHLPANDSLNAKALSNRFIAYIRKEPFFRGFTSYKVSLSNGSDQGLSLVY